MQEIIEALEAAGYTYMQNVMEPDFDYPLNFFGRQDNDDIMVLGDIEETVSGTLIVLRPFDKFKEWLIKDAEEIPFFINSFDETFKEFAQFIEENWTW
jgi:hypothetical protein